MRNAIAGLALASVLLPAAPIVAEEQDEKWQQEVEELRGRMEKAEARKREMEKNLWELYEAYCQKCIEWFFSTTKIEIEGSTKAKILTYLEHLRHTEPGSPYIWLIHYAEFVRPLKDRSREDWPGIESWLRDNPEAPRAALIDLGGFVKGDAKDCAMRWALKRIAALGEQS